MAKIFIDESAFPQYASLGFNRRTVGQYREVRALRLHWRRLFALALTVLIIAMLFELNMPTDDGNVALILSDISKIVIGGASIVDLVQTYRKVAPSSKTEAAVTGSRWTLIDRVVLVSGTLLVVSGVYKLWLLIAAGH